MVDVDHEFLFEHWLTYIFCDPKAPVVDFHPCLNSMSNADELTLFAMACRRASSWNPRFDDPQLRAGLQELIGLDPIYFTTFFQDPANFEVSEKAVSAIPDLYRGLVPARCRPALCIDSDPKAGPINALFYMLWENMGYFGSPSPKKQNLLDEACLDAMAQILCIPHDVCIESALHGLGHWFDSYPERVCATIDDFLLSTPALRREFVDYAGRAREGEVQ